MKTIHLLAPFFFTSSLVVAGPWKVECKDQKLVINSEMNQITPPPRYGSNYTGSVTINDGSKETKYRAEIGCEMSSCSILGVDQNGAISVEIPLTDPIAPGTLQTQDTLRVKISSVDEEWSGIMICKKE